MSEKQRSWIVWVLPFLVSFGMGLGSLIGLTIVSDATTQEGPAGDAAGAAGALLLVICAGVAFVMATLTVIVARVMRRGAPDHITLRIVLSIVGGSLVGALGADPGSQPALAVWLPLLVAPVALSWTWRPVPTDTVARTG